jgi:putative radical SAM enzyme (TIGR03279 family)
MLDLKPQRVVPARAGGEIARVAPGSPAARAGLHAGEWLLAINGLVPRDTIDYSFETQTDRLALLVERGGHRRVVSIAKAPDEALGLEFTLPVFEGIRECNNRCDFCFIAGLPKGLRRTLYIRDDDYRYSFLFGTFLTLTNLDESDWQRIAYQHLSPLHVSIHATDLPIRRRLLRNPTAPDILAQLARLGTYGIQVKAQVVLCPGLNDGAILERTIDDLSAHAATVDSVAVVPVGLTRYTRGADLRPLSGDEARVVVRQVEAWQRRLRPELGRDFVYLSDEFYLLAGRRFPSARRYDGFRQLQNGVGLTRLLLRQWQRRRRDLPAALSAPRRVIWVCGRAAAPALQAIAADARTIANLAVDVLVVENSLFGGSVTVSGLLAGQDVALALRGREADQVVDQVVLPAAAFGFEGRETLDGWTLEQLHRESGLPLALGSEVDDLVALTLGSSQPLAAAAG